MSLPSLESETGSHYTQKPERRFCTLSQLNAAQTQRRAWLAGAESEQFEACCPESPRRKRYRLSL